MNTVLLQCFVCATWLLGGRGEPRDDRPTIRTRDGDLFLVPAYGKSIYLQTRGPKSTVFLGNVDMALTNASRGAELPGSVTASPIGGTSVAVLRRLDRLERAARPAANTSALARRVGRLETQLHSLRARLLLLRSDKCASRPCRHGGTCLDLPAAYHCLCPDNWEGADCDVDVNECRNFAGTDLGCQNGATCLNRDGSYECLCRKGWYGLHCTRKSVDCFGGDAEMCGHGFCVPVVGESGIRCICDRGWTTDTVGPACRLDVDECADGPRCSVNPPVECVNTPGSYRCGACPAGYEGDGHVCRDVDECAENNGGCSLEPPVACYNTLGSRVCGPCPPGYRGDGAACAWRGGCAESRGGCHPAAACVETGGAASCRCPAGMRGTGEGPRGCWLPAEGEARCEDSPCGAHGRCVSLPGGYWCECAAGWSGPHCEASPEPCASAPCERGGTCRAEGAGWRCECPAQYSGRRCELAARVCGGVLDAREGSIVYPPGNATSYSHESRCAWVVHTAPDKVINITFTKFDIEYIQDCAYDFLQIHDGRSSASQLIGRFCGKDFPKGGNIVSSHNDLYFWFRSDQTVSRGGFALHWSSVPPACGGELAVTSHGTINSPGWPGKYPPNRDCHWRLTAPMGKRIQIHFFQLDIESQNNCSHDYLALYDGTLTTDPVLNKYCSSGQPAPTLSTGSEMLIHFHSDASASGDGFQMSYAVAEGVPGCGGLYTADHGELTSPSYNGRYLGDMVCDYRIKVQPNIKVRLEFVTFKLERSFNCKYDYIKIYDGEGPDASFVGKFCGTNVPKTYLSTSNVVTVKFKSDRSLSDEGFKIKYESVCHQNVVGDSGQFSSPNYPHEYPTNRLCEYIISTTVGKAIQLTFQDFDLEDNNYYSCQYDYVEIRDGPDNNSTVLGRYCGGAGHIPPVLTSSLNYMYVAFSSDMSISGAGFLANYTTIVTNCGGIYKDATGLINFPSDPSNNPTYEDDQNCEWLLVAPPGQHIKITWNRFDIEEGPSCVHDSIELNEIDDSNERNPFGKFCGTNNPPAITTSTNRLEIKFTSDSVTRGAGFSISYSFLELVNHCGGTFMKSSGRLRSPGWPNHYAVNRDCQWVITVPSGRQIALNISKFDLEPPIAGKCDYGDYLEIRNGGSLSSPLVGRFCGTNIPRRITSLGTQLHLYFHSDFYLGAQGFDIEWDGTVTGCGGTLTQWAGSITSPNYPQNYNDNAECFYKIATNTGSRIRISFTALDLEQSRGCRDDYVEIYDGKDNSARKLGRYCTMTGDNSNIETSSNFAFIKFRSDVLMGGKGFNLNYYSICQNNITGSYGVIESPNYPNRYPQASDCVWFITVPKGNRINVTFTHFDVYKPVIRRWRLRPFGSRIMTPIQSNREECEDDHVQLKDGDRPFNNKLCGNIIPSKITTKSNVLQIKFISGANVLSGFRLEWVKDGCGGTFVKDYGTIKLPNGKVTSSELECEWNIETTPGTAVKITFSSVYMTQSVNCTTDALEIYDGQDIQAPLLTKICRRGISIYQSSTNLMTIRLVKKSDYRDVSFVGMYETTKTTKGKCGGTLHSLSGVLTSPNYPKNYDNNVVCSWYLSVPSNHVIEFNILDLDLYSSEDMSNYMDTSVPRPKPCGDDIKVYDGGYTVGIVHIQQICPRSLTKQIISKSNKLGILFASDNYGTAKGFKANFTVTCGATIPIRTDGILTNDLLSVQHSNRSCIWILLASDPEQKISFTLTHLSLPIDTNVISNRHCPSSYLRIYDGNDREAPLIKEFCGRKISPMIVSKGSAITVELGSNTGVVEGMFTAHYTTIETACGGSLTSEEGSLASPNYPQSYPQSISCEWIINTSPGNQVFLSFETFDLQYTEKCNGDYLEIRENNGGGKLLGLYCGSEVPINTTVASKIYIRLHTDTIGSGRGFLAHYGFIHGNEIEGLERGEIASPLFPNAYSGPAEYTWRISLTGSEQIIITFLKLEIDNRNAYCYNSLSIYDGYDDTSPLIKQFCGLLEGYNTVVKTTSSIAYFKLKLDNSNIGSLFHAEWSKDTADVDIGEKKVTCGSNGTIDVDIADPVEFKTPTNEDGTYNHELICEWFFQVKQGYHLKVWFETFDLEHSSACLLDYVSIYTSKTGGDDWKPVREHICEISTDAIVSSNFNNNIKINFTSDSSLSYSGFRGFVAALCGGRFTDLSGVIEMKWDCWNHSTLALDYEWTVKVRPGRTINVMFEQFNITNVGDNCLNYVKLYNGESKESPILGNGKYCGFSHEDRTQSLITSANALYVSYHYEGVLFNSFKIRYEELDVECGVTSKLDTDHFSEIIGTPNYPSVPNPYTECSWVFTGPPGEILRIDFINRFDLEKTDECETEYVEIRDGASETSPLKGRFCHSAPGTIKSTNNVMYIKYSTQIAEPRNGFQANISISVCGGTIIAKEGELSSPGYPHMLNLPVGTVCEWKIKGFSGHVFHIKQLDVSLPESQTSCGTKIEIEEILAINKTTNILKTICNSDTATGEALDTFSNEVYFRLIIGKRPELTSLSEYRGFRFEFSSAAPRCGGTITGVEGFISTPGYPRETTIRFCQWLITAPNPARSVKLEFIDAEFNKDVHRIGIFNDHSFQSVIMSIPSKDWSPLQTVFQSSGNKLAIYLWIAPLANQHRFKAKYTTDEASLCGTLDDENIEFSSPNTNSSYFCNWVYKAKTQNENIYKSLYVNLKVNTSSPQNHCRFIDPKFSMKSNIERISPFTRDVCRNIEEVYRIPSLNVEFKAMQGRAQTLQFHVEIMKQPCGGALIVGENSDNILNLPSNHKGSLDCGWIIQLPPGNRAELNIQGSFDKPCADEFIKISNNNAWSQRSAEIGDYCKDRLPPPTISVYFRTLYVQYHNNDYKNSSNLKLTANTVNSPCGGHIMSGFDKTFSSPNYPKRYNENQECSWEISASVGNRITLSFVDRFVIEDKPNCTSDSVTIYDWQNDEYIQMGKVCGRIIPPAFNSTNQKMKVVFRSDGQNNLDGFKAQWTTFCGGNYIATTNTQYLYSPGYPNDYSIYLNCEYKISSGNKGKLLVQFIDFELEGTYPSCNYDNLTVTTHSTYVLDSRTYCGTQKPPTEKYISVAEINFKTDRFMQKKGFKISYEMFLCESVIREPTILTLTNDTNKNYDHNQNCTWAIEAPSDKLVIVKLSYIDLEETTDCQNDYLAAYEGLWTDPDKRIALLCGHLNSTTTLRSVGNTMLLNFVSDFSQTFGGFKAEVFFSYSKSVGCGGDIILVTQSSRKIKTPLLNNNVVYENYMDCLWNIKAAEGKVILAEFKSFHISPCEHVNQTALGYSNCKCDYVEILDGLNPNSLLIGKYCGHSLPPAVLSSGQFMAIRFFSDGSITSSGFELELSIKESECGQTQYHVNHTTTLTSPGFQRGSVPRGLHCSYYIYYSQDLYNMKKITIKYLDLLPENYQNNECTDDKLIITNAKYNANETFGANLTLSLRRDSFLHQPYSFDFAYGLKFPKIYTYCGVRKSIDLYSYGNIMINLQTAPSSLSSTKHKGFEIEVSVITWCGRNYTEPQGRIMTSYLDTTDHPSQEECYTSIVAPENHTISLYFFSLYGIYWNDDVYLEFFDGNSTTAPLLRKTGHTYEEEKPIFSTGRYILIHSVRSKDEKITFDSNYVTTDKGRGCGGKLENIIGLVTSSMYPNIYRKVQTCEWELQTPVGSKLLLHFKFFDLGNKCDSNNVQLVDRNGIVFSTYCDEMPANYKSPDNYVKIVSKTSLNNAGTGWVAEFITVE